MVNRDRIRGKLPELLVNGPLTIKENLYDYQTKRKKLRRIERQRKSVFNHYLGKIVRAFKEFEEAMEQDL